MLLQIFFALSIGSAFGNLMNWSTLEITTLDELKKKNRYTILTEKNCTVCDAYLDEVLSCSDLQHSEVSVIAAGDDTYLRKLRIKLPSAIQLYKTTQKQMSRITKLTPTTFINNTKRDGFQRCSQLNKEVQRD
jgi:hypothetical protein